MKRLPEKGRPAVIAVTGYGQRSDRLKTRAAGFDGHLVKPIKPDHLLGLLSNLAHEAADG
jgi:CheY-like chemotaxis protein